MTICRPQVLAVCWPGTVHLGLCLFLCCCCLGFCFVLFVVLMQGLPWVENLSLRLDWSPSELQRSAYMSTPNSECLPPSLTVYMGSRDWPIFHKIFVFCCSIQTYILYSACKFLVVYMTSKDFAGLWIFFHFLDVVLKHKSFLLILIKSDLHYAFPFSLVSYLENSCLILSSYI